MAKAILRVYDCMINACAVNADNSQNGIALVCMAYVFINPIEKMSTRGSAVLIIQYR